MRHGMIISPLARQEDLDWLQNAGAEEGYMILCADGGYEAALAMGLTPDLLIGDMDSSCWRGEVCCPVKRFPIEKDETDTVLCLRQGAKMGLKDMVLLGGFGGRMDHTYANIQTMAYAQTLGVHLEVIGGNTWASLLSPGRHRVKARKGCKLSLFAFSPKVEGLTLRGVHYPLKNGVLTADFPLGVSNAFEAEQAEILFEAGLLLVMVGKDE